MNKEPIFENWSPFMTWATCREGQWSDVTTDVQGPRELHPGAMSLQFGLSAFEGMKARRIAETSANLFRVEDNYRRLTRACERLCIPSPTLAMFREAILQGAARTSMWNDPFQSTTLYIRPILLSLDTHIMPVVANNYAFCTLFAPLRISEPQNMSLLVEERYSRAAPGGLGAVKTASNYAHQVLPTRNAREKGFDAVLWLDCCGHTCIEEASTMNVFFRVGDRVLTPALTDTILPGITRMSTISLLHEGGYSPVERSISISELIRWIETGTLQEMFVTSTALGVSAVDRIGFAGRVWTWNSDGKVCNHVRKRLEDIFCTGADSDHPWIEKIKLITDA